MDGSHLTFDSFYLPSVFLINCQIGPFTRNHKCRQMSRKCQGLRQEGDSGSVQSTLATERTEFEFFLHFFLGIDATTELQQKLKKEINKAGRRVCERPGSIRYLRSCVIDHHTPTDGIHWEQFCANSFPKLLVFLSCMM